MQANIQNIKPKKLVGIHQIRTLENDNAFELWSRFMPRKKEIQLHLNNDLISLQVYHTELKFNDFTPNTPFENWAAIEVSEFINIPMGMETFYLSGGLYAQFNYQGNPQKATLFFQKVFTEWLPVSTYTVDNTRPHFQVLGEKFKNNHDESEEEIWIPIALKQ